VTVFPDPSCDRLYAEGLSPASVKFCTITLMHEILLVLASIAGVAVIGFIAKIMTPEIMIEFGLWILVGGLLIGIPSGVWYHVVLYRALKRRMPPPAGWWRRPVELHARLTPVEFRPVRPWVCGRRCRVRSMLRGRPGGDCGVVGGTVLSVRRTL